MFIGQNNGLCKSYNLINMGIIYNEYGIIGGNGYIY